MPSWDHTFLTTDEGLGFSKYKCSSPTNVASRGRVAFLIEEVAFKFLEIILSENEQRLCPFQEILIEITSVFKKNLFFHMRIPIKK